MVRFKKSTAMFYAAQVLIVLEYLHSLEIVYRDIKPENIVLDRRGYIKLIDFGLSKILEKAERTYTVSKDEKKKQVTYNFFNFCVLS